MKQAVSYIRFSSGPQAKGSSLVRQQEMIAKWLAANAGYQWCTTRFEDLGLSGLKGKHLDGGMGKLLAAVDEGAIKAGDVIICEDVSRAGRMPPMDMLTKIIDPILRAGVSIITLDDHMEYTKTSLEGSHIFLLVAKIQAANQYSESLSRRIKASFKTRREKAALGLGVKRRGPVWLTSEGELREDIAPLVKEAFELYADGIGERRIHARIHDKHPDLAKISPASIKRWLENRTAIGYWGDIGNVYPCVVEPATFYRVQERIAQKKRPKASPIKYAMTGLVACGSCGAGFCTRNYKERSPTVMDCVRHGHGGPTACGNSRGIPLQVLEYVFLHSKTKAMLQAMKGRQTSENTKRSIVVQGELQVINRKMEQLAKAMQAIDEDVDELIAQMKDRKAERDALQAELVLLQSEKIPMTWEFVAGMEKDIFKDDPMRANALLQGVGYSIVCQPDGTMTVDGMSWRYKGWDRVGKVFVVDDLTYGVTRRLPRNTVPQPDTE